jgi:hypothetical protein
MRDLSEGFSKGQAHSLMCAGVVGREGEKRCPLINESHGRLEADTVGRDLFSASRFPDQAANEVVSDHVQAQFLLNHLWGAAQRVDPPVSDLLYRGNGKRHRENQSLVYIP